ncbi:protein CFAP20DC isoform X2 [Paramormyrops kingsleyae]|uniref:protein CFAP20DC isoform X2 n=1 Tax=Paramormyrops kingsleyae TaxID=1676925 RepID=UPI003B971DC8
MFKNEYQGGAVVDIFSAQGKDPVAKWKLHGGQSAISKVFDKEMKGFVYILEGSSQANKMQMPKDNKIMLGLSQRFLVLQVYLPLGKDFSTELIVTDLESLKRRLYLSTVHKEFTATPLHARIPLSSLKRSIWSNMCIDLMSLTGEIFKGASFLSLDGITVSATCRLRRVFTMKVQPTDAFSHATPNNCGHNSVDVTPRSFQFPADVQHITQVVNMDMLRVEISSSISSTTESEQKNSPSLASVRGTRSHFVSHIAFGSKVPGPPPATGRKTSASSCPEACSSATRTAVATKINEDWPKKHTDQCEQILNSPQDFTLQQKCPGKDQGPEESADGTSSTVNSAGHQSTGQMKKNSRNYRDDARQDSWSFPFNLKDFDGFDLDPESQVHQRSPGALLSWEGDEKDEMVEPQLTLKEDFNFSSRPRYARRFQGHTSTPEVTVSSPDWRGNWHGADRGPRMEDDFIGSESDEGEASLTILIQKPNFQSCLNDSVSQSLDGDDEWNISRLEESDSQKELIQPSTTMASLSTDSGYKKATLDLAHWTDMVPVRSLSPSGTGQGPNSFGAQKACQQHWPRTSFSRRSLREIPRGAGRMHVERTAEDGRENYSVKNSSEVSMLFSLGMQEEEELHMLASLCRQKEEDSQEGASWPTGLSASQIHNCTVSISSCSDETSTWTPRLHMPANQGHHYQTEIHPLLHSNPREWLGVFSPPIIPPSEHTSGTGNSDHRRDIMKGRAVSMSEADAEDEFLTVLYDPCLNCYFDPESGKYYELV